jgi:hypothetical protein
MNARKFARLGVPEGEAMRLAGTAVRDARAFGIAKRDIPQMITAVVENPADYLQDELLGELAAALMAHEVEQPTFKPRKAPAPFQVWGENLDENSVNQMKNAAQLPVSVRGALMPDAHLGYGLPIGGVLATQCGDSVRGRRGHRLPHEADRAGTCRPTPCAASKSGWPTPSSPRPALAWARFPQRGAARASGDGDGLARNARHPTPA